MSVRTETLQLRVVVDGSPARRELATLDQEYAKINSELRDLKKNTTEYVAATKRMGEIRSRQEELRKEIGLTALTAKQLTDELRRLQVSQRNLTPNTKAWAENAQRIEEVKNRLRELTDVNVRAQQAWNAQSGSMRLTNMSMKQLELEANRLKAVLHTMSPNAAGFSRLRNELVAVERQMANVRTGMGPFGRMWQSMKGQIAATGAVLGATLAGAGIMQLVKGWVDGAAKLSDAQADVQRTTGMTRAEVNQLTESLGRLNTRTARAELLALAADAGKLGITAQKDVLAFVKAGDQIRVALGEDLGDEAIKNIGKLNQTFKVGEATGKGLEAQMLSTGSAINALGQASTAQESYLVDFATRMAGVNTQANINVQDTLGYAAALDQLGQRSETASTALSQFTLKAFKETATYAKIAGMSTKEFSELLNRDANEALLRTLEGLNGNNEGLSRMTALFGDMGQEGTRAVSTLASLASNTKLVREQQAIANKEFAAGTSITNEFNTKNNTLAANLELIGKRLAGAFVSSGAVDAINGIARGLADWLKQPVDAELQKQRISVNALVFETMQLNQGDEKRIANIQQLKKEYPQFAQFLDAETATNAELAVVLDRVNAAYVKKILLARSQEDIADIQDRQAEAIESEGSALDQLNTERTRAMVQMNATQKQLFAESYHQIAGYWEKVQTLEHSEVGRSMRFNTWMQKNGMPATLYDEMRKVIGAEKAYERALDRRVAIDEEFQQKMARINQLAAMVGGDEPVQQEQPTAGGAVPELSAKDQEKMKAALDQWRQELIDFRQRIYEDGLSADERDIAQLDVKHAREREKLLANKLATEADLLALEEVQARERANLIEAQGEERVKGYSDAADKIRRAMLSSAEREIDDEISKWDQLIALALKYGIDATALEEAKEEAKAAVRKRYRDKELADDAAANKAQLQARIGLYQGIGQAAAGLNSFLSAIYSDAQGRAFEDTEWGKTLALVQIATNAAVAVSQAVASSTAGDPYSLAARVAVAVGAVLGAIGQAYSVLNRAPATPPPPSSSGAAAGSASNIALGEKGLVLDGPSHAEDGLKVVNPKTGQVTAELEGGELVLSKLFTRNNRALVPMLLQLSATGARLPIGRSGGIFGKVAPFNFAGAIQALDASRFTRGMAMVNMPTQGGTGETGNSTAQVFGTDPEVKSLLRQLLLKPLVVSTKEIDRRKSELTYLEDQGRVRRLK